MKKFVLCLAFIMLCHNAYSVEVNELNSPLPIEYRLGTNDDIEQKYELKNIQTEEDKRITQLKKEKEAVKKVTYADLTLNSISKDMISGLNAEQKYMLEDLKTLWVGAASRSESVRFAIYKLSNPDEDKPSGGVVKKIIKPLASMTALAGLGVPNPFIGTAALMSGTLFNSLSITDKDLNYKYSKVTDADMVVLVRKLDDLQKNLTAAYYEYIQKRNYLNQMNEIVEKRQKLVDKQINSQKEVVQILDTFFKEAVEERNRARSNFLYIRSELEQLVGADCLAQFEKSLNEREF